MLPVKTVLIRRNTKSFKTMHAILTISTPIVDCFLSSSCPFSLVHTVYISREKREVRESWARGGGRKGDLGRTGAVDVQKGLTENWVGGLEG